MVRYAGEQIFQQANSNVNKNVFGSIIYNVKAYGAKGDGETDDTLAIQATIDAAGPLRGTVFFPPGNYIVTQQLNIPWGFMKIMGSGGVNYQTEITATLSSGHVFNVTASVLVFIRGFHIINNSSQGHCIALGGESHRVEDCKLDNKAGNTDDMIYYTGSNIHIYNNVLTNIEPFAYAIHAKAVVGQIHINCYIEGNYIAGLGSGVLVDADNSTRPEGLKVINNVFLNTGTEQLTVRSIYDIIITGNMLDQSTLYGIYLDPTVGGLGIVSVHIDANYISTAGGLTGGVAIFAPNVSPGVADVMITCNKIDYAGYGIVNNANSFNWVIEGNSFANIDQDAIALNQSNKQIIANNPRIKGTTHAITLTDGASGGPFIVKNNFLEGPVLLTKTTASKFVLQDNDGYVTSKRTSGTFPATPASSQTAVIPHGLAGVPDLNKCTIGVYQNGSGAEFGGSWIVSADATNVTVQVKVTFAGTGNAICTLYAEV